MIAAQWIDAHTPTLSVMDPRGLALRKVGYCRKALNLTVEPRINQNRFDAAGRLVACWDPRLRQVAPKPNVDNIFDLLDRRLSIDSVDAGWQLNLWNEAGVAHSFWDGRGSHRQIQYDKFLRPTIVSEHLAQEPMRVCDRFIYGDSSMDFAAHNQCNKLVRHDHPAGSRSVAEYGVTGLQLSEQSRFPSDPELLDWSGERDVARLEEVFETTQGYGPLGEMRSQIDAGNNIRLFGYDRAGQLASVRLGLADSSQMLRLLASDFRYDALGNNVSERIGNGVVNCTRFDSSDCRLMQLQSHDADGRPLQNLIYEYDPVGNVISIEDRAQMTRYFDNQRVEPVNRYTYDSLYQLIKATGREVSQPSYGPALPLWQTMPLDPNQLRNYTQAFDYDAAGNLATRHHTGAEKFQMYTSLYNNRSVADEIDLTIGFDVSGNQLELLRGQRMTWDIRNQLRSVTMVNRTSGPDDMECYCYERPGHRVRKFRLAQTPRRTLRSEVIYLPGLEIHRDLATRRYRHVLNIEAGRSQVRVLHWVTHLPRHAANDQLFFGLSDHLRSSTLELDERGGVVSREVYYPFGGTAVWAGSGEINGTDKTRRYCGNERDATGLYYYGYRYYAPWLQRWISADPAGDVDGLNLYLFCGNSPTVNIDRHGLQWSESRFRSRYRPITYLNEQEGAAGERIVETVERALNEAISAITLVETSLGSEGGSDTDPLASYYINNSFGPEASRESLINTLGQMKEVLSLYSLLPENILFVERPYTKQAIGKKPADILYAGVRIVPKDPMERMVISEDELNSEGTLDIAFIHAAAVSLGAHELMPYSRGYPMIAEGATPFFGQSLIDGKFDDFIVSRVHDRLSIAEAKYFLGVKGMLGLDTNLSENPSVRSKILMQDAGVLSFFVKTLSFALGGEPPPPYPRELMNRTPQPYPSKGQN